nr:hypothetical protein [uncultured Mucilaginibacter sp.]
MKKCYLFWLLLLALSFKTYAQADLEAKAAYLLAEEKYGKGDMKATLEYLDEAAGKLGSANAKILYLKIMAQRELANKDQRYLTKLDSTIALFQNSPDAKAFNEEKALEIMKIKLELKKELARIPSAKDAAAMAAAGIKLYESEHPDWPLGAPTKTIKNQHSDLFRTFTVINNDQGAHYVNINATQGTSVFSFRNDRLFRYQEKYFDYKDDDLEHTKGKATFASVLENFRKKFGYLPIPEIVDQPQNGKLHTESYIWKDGDKTILLMVSYFDVYQKGYSNALSDITDNSIK